MKKIIPLFIVLVLITITVISCQKEEPITCTSNPECIATPMDTLSRELLVGKWKFYKQAWLYETINGTVLEWRTPEDLGIDYEIEFFAEGKIKITRNDTVILDSKLKEKYDLFNGVSTTEENIGIYGCWKQCIENEENRTSFRLQDLDTMIPGHRPVPFDNSQSGERSGKGYFYRMH